MDSPSQMETGIVVGLSLAGLVAGLVQAFADGWGYCDCSQYPNPGCELGVGKSGQGNSHHNGEGNHPPGQTKGHHGSGNPGGPGNSGDTLLGRRLNPANCS